MITAVDTSVLLDIFFDEPAFRPLSLAALRACLAAGPILACDVVWAEVRAVFGDDEAAARVLAGFPVTYSAIDARTASRAGAAWGAYRQRGGPRDRVVADYLIGAHALEQADRLLTRDRGFHRLAFAGLVIVDPSAAGG
ncbi:MAG: type II toxin-antitoxin system VapC family toxin [Chloroflexota bacterium]